MQINITNIADWRLNNKICKSNLSFGGGDDVVIHAIVLYFLVGDRSVTHVVFWFVGDGIVTHVVFWFVVDGIVQQIQLIPNCQFIWSFK